MKSRSAGKNKNVFHLLLIFAFAQTLASCSLNKNLDFTDRKYFKYPLETPHIVKKEVLNTPKANTEQNQNPDYRATLENELHFGKLNVLSETCVSGETPPNEKENTVPDKLSNKTSKLLLKNVPIIKKHLQSILQNKHENNLTTYWEINDNKELQQKSHLKSPLPSDRFILEVILSVILPPLAVYLHEGRITNFFWIDLLLIIFFWVPGVIFALLVVLDVIK